MSDPLLAGVTAPQARDLMDLYAAITARGPAPCDGDDRFTRDARATNATIREAAAVCQACPVHLECLAYGLSYPHEKGIYGGLTPTERTHDNRQDTAA